MTKQAVAVAISEDIRTDILRGIIRPGEPLRIRQLAERFGTSDLPVREALWILQKDGLVENRPYAGAFVREHSATEISEAYEVRSALEKLALLKTPAKVPESLLAETRAIMTALEEAARNEDSLRYGDLNREFHQKILSASTNRSLLELLDRLWSGQSAYRIVFATNQKRIAQSLAEHKLIFEAFERGDMVAAGEILEAHRQNGVIAALESLESLASRQAEGGRP